MGPKEVASAIGEAERLLDLVTDKAFSNVKGVEEKELSRIVTLGSRSLLLQALGRASRAIALLDDRSLEECSAAQRAMIAGILVDKAEKLAALANVGTVEGVSGLTPETFTELLHSASQRATRLKAMGIEITMAPQPQREEVTREGPPVALPPSPPPAP